MIRYKKKKGSTDLLSGRFIIFLRHYSGVSTGVYFLSIEIPRKRNDSSLLYYICSDHAYLVLNVEKNIHF